jgi:hypothetical protein
VRGSEWKAARLITIFGLAQRIESCSDDFVMLIHFRTGTNMFYH